MLALSSQLPEHPVLMRMFSVGPVLGPQLMAKIGDVRRFDRKQSLVAFAGVDAPPCQSDTIESKTPSAALPGCARRFSKSCPLSFNTRPLTILYSNFCDRQNSTVCFAAPIFVGVFFEIFLLLGLDTSWQVCYLGNIMLRLMIFFLKQEKSNKMRHS